MAVFKMSYGANDKPVVVAAKVEPKKAAPRRRTKPNLTAQAQALFEPATVQDNIEAADGVALAEPDAADHQHV